MCLIWIPAVIVYWFVVCFFAGFSATIVSFRKWLWFWFGWWHNGQTDYWWSIVRNRVYQHDRVWRRRREGWLFFVDVLIEKLWTSWLGIYNGSFKVFQSERLMRGVHPIWGRWIWNQTKLNLRFQNDQSSAELLCTSLVWIHVHMVYYYVLFIFIAIYHLYHEQHHLYTFSRVELSVPLHLFIVRDKTYRTCKRFWVITRILWDQGVLEPMGYTVCLINVIFIHVSGYQRLFHSGGVGRAWCLPASNVSSYDS